MDPTKQNLSDKDPEMGPPIFRNPHMVFVGSLCLYLCFFWGSLILYFGTGVRHEPQREVLGCLPVWLRDFNNLLGVCSLCYSFTVESFGDVQKPAKCCLRFPVWAPQFSAARDFV